MKKRVHRIGVFAGSFEPFTTGHANIVERALQALDELHIVVGYNILKGSGQVAHHAQQRAAEIQSLYADIDRVVVTAYGGLTAKYAEQVGAQLLVRSIRSVKDYEYELDLAVTNRTAFGLDTLFFLADPVLSSVSGSMVRELDYFGVDTSPYRPTRDQILAALSTTDSSMITVLEHEEE